MNFIWSSTFLRSLWVDESHCQSELCQTILILRTVGCFEFFFELRKPQYISFIYESLSLRDQKVSNPKEAACEPLCSFLLIVFVSDLLDARCQIGDAGFKSTKRNPFLKARFFLLCLKIRDFFNLKWSRWYTTVSKSNSFFSRWPCRVIQILDSREAQSQQKTIKTKSGAIEMNLVELKEYQIAMQSILKKSQLETSD